MMKENEELDFYQAIYRFLYQRVNSEVVAEDLTQEVFFKLAKLEDRDIIKSNRAFIFTIARNTLTDFYRRDKPSVEYDENSYTAEVLEKEDNEISSCVLSMMRGLSSEEANLLMKVDYEGLSQKELSQDLEVDYTTLKSKVQRARKKLNKRLVSCCDFDRDRRGTIFSCKKK